MKALIFILFLGLMFTGCKKTNVSSGKKAVQKQQVTYQSTGVITGFDHVPCPFLECGGLKIILQNDPTKTPPPYYLIYTTPPQLSITNSTKFPFNVSLSWQHDTTANRGPNDILVSDIKVIN